MDGNQRKIRNLLLYIGIPVVVLFIIILLFNNRVPQTAAYKYSDILDYFQSQEVTGYRLNLGTGDMAIQLESGETIGYQLPSVDLFYMDVRDSIQQYNEEHPDSKMVQDIIRPQETSWLISLLPTLIMFAVLIIFWVVMMRRLGSSMGGDKQMNFGKAKIKQMSDEKRKTTFADVAGADEEKEELREIVEFLKNPSSTTPWAPESPRVCCWWALPAPVRHCWPGPWPERPGCPSSPSPALTLWRCLWAWALPVCGTCSTRPRRTTPASSSLTKSTPWAAREAPAWAAGTTSASRP